MKFLLYTFTLLMLPALAVFLMYGNVAGNLFSIVLSAAGFSVVLCALGILLHKIHYRIAVVAVTFLLLIFFIIRVLLGFLFDFSGRGFTSEFFAHIELKSLEVGISEYGAALIPLLLGIIALAVITSRLLHDLKKNSAKSGVLSLLFSFVLIYFGASASPEIRLANAFQRYTSDSQPILSDSKTKEEIVALLAPLRGTKNIPVQKNMIQAQLPEEPLNLVVIYLESFNEMLTESKKYPGLTPHMDVLKKKYHYFSRNFSSAYVTVEGIADSQCGTLMNMDYANNSLTNAKGRLPVLPCLGDVLNKAGYHQVYLGGADIAFAGKGDFLKEHGYDEVLGLNHWRRAGHKAQTNVWGLPDTTLFNEAFDRIKTFHKKKIPFNVSMLTLGTHIPGFTYEGCPSYSQAPNEPFLNAIHCTDFLLGKFISQLEKEDILKNTVLFIQADHGVFPSREMKNLFGKDVEDRRLFTLVSTPDIVNNQREQWSIDAPIASVDMAPTLLDAMGIQHNVSFIVGHSQFNNKSKPVYKLTRYEDYTKQGKKIRNNPMNCTEPDVTNTLNFPLDDCAKDKALRAVYTLGATYTGISKTSHVCRRGATVYMDPNSGKVHLFWGRTELTGEFYGQGRTVSKAKGVYLLLLDENDEILQQLFFAHDIKRELQRLQRALSNLLPGQHALLISNVRSQDVGESLINIWPKILIENQAAYITNTKQGENRIEWASSKLDFAIKLQPQSCPGGVQVSAIDNPIESELTAP